MALILVAVCNICKDPTRATTTYHITSRGRETEVAFCAEHDTLGELFTSKTIPKSGGTATRPRPKRSTLSRRHATLEEIEAAKKG